MVFYAIIKNGTMLLMKQLLGLRLINLDTFFVTMLLFCEVSDEYAFFEKVWKLLVDDIQYNFREMIGHSTYQMTDNEL